MTKPTLILIDCTDALGLVALISNIIASHKLNIVAMREFVDEDANKFFARIVCHGDLLDQQSLEKDLQALLPSAATILVNPTQKKRLVVLVTKEHHCLADILVRDNFETLGAEVSAVIGNYQDLAPFTEKFGIPFHHISHLEKSKEDFEQEIIQQIDAYQPDYIILAKYMRILSPAFVAQFKGKIINIHHSFLPAFIGANPYKQAHTRGVKIIGATAHFVTDDLDEGPIITQDVRRVNHTFTVKDMVTAGKEVEKAVLSKALQFVIEDRVLIHGNRTIVFE